MVIPYVTRAVRRSRQLGRFLTLQRYASFRYDGWCAHCWVREREWLGEPKFSKETALHARSPLHTNPTIDRSALALAPLVDDMHETIRSSRINSMKFNPRAMEVLVHRKGLLIGPFPEHAGAF